MGIFGAAHGCGGGQKGPFPKISHTYPAMMKLGTVIPYLKKIQKYMNHVTQPLKYADRKSANFLISRNTDIDCIFT